MSLTLTPVPPAPVAAVTTQDKVLVQLSAAVRALESASDPGEVLDVRDWAQALSGYLSRRDEGLHTTIKASEVFADREEQE